jgi:hypothetical protein
MRNAVDALGAAGIGLGDATRPEVRSSLAELARRVREEGVRTLGLAPADDDVAIPPLAIALGRSLAEMVGGPVAVVDAAGGWPCAPELLEFTQRPSAALATSWIADRLAILTPHPVEPGDALSTLAAILSAGAVSFEQVVVDLTGLDHLGASAGAFHLLDGTALVARVGRTSVRRVARAYRDIPDPRRLGVVLTGA